jgi:hypothetical protein
MNSFKYATASNKSIRSMLIMRMKTEVSHYLLMMKLKKNMELIKKWNQISIPLINKMKMSNKIFCPMKI